MNKSMSGDAASDEQLMKAYAEGDAAAFQELYRRFEQRLYIFFVRRLFGHRKESASDLFQKTWLKAHQARTQFDASRSFSTWIFTIALNTLRDHLGAAAELVRADTLESQVDAAELAQDDLEKKLLLREELAQVSRALEALPITQREAMMLAEWEGLSAAEIGQVLDLSENAARQLLFRARSKLRSLLGKES